MISNDIEILLKKLAIYRSKKYKHKPFRFRTRNTEYTSFYAVSIVFLEVFLCIISTSQYLLTYLLIFPGQQLFIFFRFFLRVVQIQWLEDFSFENQGSISRPNGAVHGCGLQRWQVEYVSKDVLLLVNVVD